MISEIGLRYPPTSRQDEEGRAGLIAMLATDLADVPVSLLSAAAAEWARTKAFMPKASELRNLAETVAKARHYADQHTGSMADRANARLAEEGKPPLWAMLAGACQFVGPPIVEKRAPPLTRAEIARMSPEMISLGRAKGYLVEGPDGGLVDSQTATGRGYFQALRDDEAA